MTTKREMAVAIVKALYNTDDVSSEVNQRRIRRLVNKHKKEFLERDYLLAQKVLAKRKMSKLKGER